MASGQTAGIRSDRSAAVEAIFKATGATGMVIAIVRGDDVSITGYGRATPGSDARPTARSLVSIGSISKLLSDDLMVRLEREGRLHLSDPVALFAPDAATSQRLESGRPMTLLDLATHTSGLPRIVDLTSSNESATSQRWRWLKDHATASPGSAAVYSNFAYDVLADSLAAAARAPYVVALKTYVTQPLGMVDTTAEPTSGQCARLMAGQGKPETKLCASGTSNAGSGGMYSTASDMALWIKTQLGFGVNPDKARLAISQAVYVQREALPEVEGLDLAGHADGIGLGWLSQSAAKGRPAILEKTGGGNGFMTYLVLAPGRKVGIFVAVSKVDVPMLSAMAASVNDLAAQIAL